MPRNRIVTAAALRERLIRELLDEDSDWDLAHDRNRPPKYYPDGNDEAVVLTILDSLAAVAVPLSQRDLLNRVKSSAEPTGDEQIRGLLRLLLADH